MATKLAVLTDAESATGFRLAGAEVLEATQETALRTLEAAIQSNQYGLIAVDEGIVPDPTKAMERQMRGRDLPVLLTVPSLAVAFSDSVDAKAYMKALVRSTIGFDIKL